MPPREASFYFRVVWVFHLMGPVFGFLVGGAFLQVYTDLNLVSISLRTLLYFLQHKFSKIFLPDFDLFLKNKKLVILLSYGFQKNGQLLVVDILPKVNL